MPPANPILIPLANAWRLPIGQASGKVVLTASTAQAGGKEVLLDFSYYLTIAEDEQ